MPDSLRPALALHQAGQFDDAARLYQDALDRDPNDADALHLLGVLRHQQGDPAAAIELIGKAIALRPDVAAFHGNLAEAYRVRGDFEPALASCRAALNLSPRDADTHNNLGLALCGLGRHAEAVESFHAAVKLRPGFALAHYNLGNALLGLDRFQDARVAFFDAIRLDPKMAPAYAGLGLAWQHDGKFGDALAWLKRAVEVNPEHRLSWESLADLYREREEPAEAIACWRRVLALDPDRAASHYNLARVLQGEGHSAEAGEFYQAALRLDPGLAEAHVGLAALQEERGDLTAAEAVLREALRMKPTLASAHARLATLLRGRLPPADQSALQERLADPRLAPVAHAELLFGLAHVLDARGDYAAAADAANRANALMARHGRGSKPKYDPAEHELYVDRLVQGFGRAFFARTAGMGLVTRRPIFVFGLPRSGTTLVEQILSSHSQVHGAGELKLAKQTFNAMPTMLRRADPPLDCLADLDARRIRSLAQQHEAALTVLAAGPVQRIVDKMPDNYLLLGFLAALFPRAVFIHCRRDLRDVAVSCWMTDFRGIQWSNEVDHLATRFQQYRRLMDHWGTVLPVPMLDVDYEETVADLERVARRLIDWCDLAWEPACLRFHETERPIRTASLTQVRQPIYQRSVGRWRNYERQFADLFARLPGQ